MQCLYAPLKRKLEWGFFFASEPQLDVNMKNGLRVEGIVSVFCFIIMDVSGRAGLQARVKGFPRSLDPRRGDTGKVRMCRAYGTRISRGGFNAGLKARSTRDI